MKGSPKGIALLIILWVTTILMVIAFSFSVMTRAESFGTLVFKEGTEKKLLAEAGIERGIMEMIYRSINRNQAVTLEGMEAWKPDGTAHTFDAGNGGYVVRIIDESGKISLNGLTDSSGIILKNLLINQGTSSEHADVIVDSILDWKDADDLHRLSGAETDYYQSLAKPYKARNADFETLEELILVREITSEILYGTSTAKGIIPFLTIHGKTGKVNVNVAPKEVLAALPGMNAAMVERIIEFRRSSEIRGEAAVKDLLGAAYALMSPYANADPDASALFTVETTGYTDDEKKGYSIAATIAFDRSNQFRYVYYKSPADFIP
jgi:general secretion pathway protein K